MKQAAHSNGNHSPKQKPAPEQISQKAYELYVESGRQDGRDQEHWLRAEQLLMERAEQGARSPATAKHVEESPKQLNSPLAPREHPLARDERGSASREDIRRTTTQLRPASRQPQWRTSRETQPKQSA